MQSLIIYLELFMGQNQEITILNIIHSSEFTPECELQQVSIATYRYLI